MSNYVDFITVHVDQFGSILGVDYKTAVSDCSLTNYTSQVPFSTPVAWFFLTCSVSQSPIRFDTHSKIALSSEGSKYVCPISAYSLLDSPSFVLLRYRPIKEEMNEEKPPEDNRSFLAKYVR